MKLIFLLTIFAMVAISGCASPLLNKIVQAPSPSQSSLPSPAQKIIQTALPKATNTPQPTEEFDSTPLISSSSLNPSNPSAGDIFTLTMTAQDDKGLKQFSWESSMPLSQGQSGSFDCGLQKTCTTKFEFSALGEGVHKLTVYATDSSGQKIKNDFDVNVGPARPKVSPTPTRTPTATVTPTISTSECSSDSSCGYKQRCSGGTCISVQCTTDSQCSGCKRCSDYSCRSCGYGPYGCTC